jgi:RimJ/RimL family protein N-acetyltransferase
MIETERLILRPWQDNDLAPFATMSRSPEVQRYLGEPQSEEQIAEAAERVSGRFAKLGYGRWSVERREDGRFIGLCGVVPFDRPETPIHGEIEIGWQLDPSVWGQGYAKEAAAASLNWGWTNLDCPQIVAITVAANTASWGLMERLGMQRRTDLDFGHPLFDPGHRLHRHIAYMAVRP